MEGAEFVRAVMRCLGASGPTELVEAMGWRANAPRKVSRWLAGETSPDYEATMEMLEKCGWLAMDESVPRTTAEAAGLSADAAVEIAAKMDRALTNQAKTLKVVRELAVQIDRVLDRVEDGLPTAAPAQQRKKRTA